MRRERTRLTPHHYVTRFPWHEPVLAHVGSGRRTVSTRTSSVQHDREVLAAPMLFRPLAPAARALRRAAEAALPVLRRAAQGCAEHGGLRRGGGGGGQGCLLPRLLTRAAAAAAQGAPAAAAAAAETLAGFAASGSCFQRRCRSCCRSKGRGKKANAGVWWSGRQHGGVQDQPRRAGPPLALEPDRRQRVRRLRLHRARAREGGAGRRARAFVGAATGGGAAPRGHRSGGEVSGAPRVFDRLTRCSRAPLALRPDSCARPRRPARRASHLTPFPFAPAPRFACSPRLAAGALMASCASGRTAAC
jgi:hypothetical protein